MKNKIVIITIVLVIIIMIVSIIYLCKNVFVKKECMSTTGGSFSIIFNTDGGDSISSMHVGIAVSPDSYQDLPIPSREGYSFDGWYYDKDFTSAISRTFSLAGRRG